MNQKIFLVSTDNMLDNIYDIAEYLSKQYDLDIAITYHNINEKNKYIEYLSTDDIVLAYKNNAVLYCTTKDEYTHCLSMDEYYNKDIFCMSIEDYNSISESKLGDILVIWIDTKRKVSKFTHLEVNSFIESLQDVKYMYFLETDQKILSTIDAYILGLNSEKERILLENS